MKSKTDFPEFRPGGGKPTSAGHVYVAVCPSQKDQGKAAAKRVDEIKDLLFAKLGFRPSTASVIQRALALLEQTIKKDK